MSIRTGEILMEFFFLPVLVMVGIFSNVGMIFPSSTDESEDFLSFPGFLITLGSVGRLAREWNTLRLRMIAYTRWALPAKGNILN